MLNKELFAQMFTVMCEMVSKDPSKGLTGLYYETLKDLTDDQFSQAVNNLIQTNKYNKLPLPAEIREQALGSVDDVALRTLAYVEKVMIDIGQYESVEFADKTVHMTIEALGGWEKCCTMPEEEWKFVKKDFLKLYKAFKASPRNYPDRLVGFVERTNSFNAFNEFIPTPIRIGFDYELKLFKNGFVQKQIKPKEETILEEDRAGVKNLLNGLVDNMRLH